MNIARIVENHHFTITLTVIDSGKELWPPHAKSWLTGKDSDVGKDWGQEEKGTTENEMAGWHHYANGYELGQTLGGGSRQRPGVLQSMGSQRVGHDWANEQQQQVFHLLA